MRSGVFSREVISETIEYIPIDGISFPILVSTDNPPYSDMSVTLSLNSGAKASINYKQLNFTRTQKVQNFTVFVDEDQTIGEDVEVTFSIGGTDGPSFTLPVVTLNIPIVARELFLPEVVAGSVLSTTRTSAEIQIQGNTLAFLYFMVADLYVPVPIFSDVRDKVENETLSYSNPSFQVTYIKTASRTVTFTLEGLEPGKDYDFYCYIVNLN